MEKDSILDFSKCQCDHAGWCDLFKRNMPTVPPNFQWCQSLSPEERQAAHKQMCSKPIIIEKAKKNFVNLMHFYDELPEKRSDRAVCVIPANDWALELLDITRESIVAYAKKCNADYIELTGDQIPTWPMSNKYRLANVTPVYEKTLYLDCDIRVMPHAPDIFDATPDDKISVFDEFSNWIDRNWTDWIKLEQDIIVRYLLEDEQYSHLLDNGKFVEPNKMFQGGVLVIPKSLAGWYKQPDRCYPRQACFDQNYLTLTLPEELHHNLDEKFNLTWQKMDFTYVNLHSDFLSKAQSCYFMHVNGELDRKLRKKILSWDFSNPTRNKLLLHENVSTIRRWNGCDLSEKKQHELNHIIYDYVESQPEQRIYSLDDVKIACIGHSQEQFDRIKDKPYITKVNLKTLYGVRGVRRDKFSDNVWAETRVWSSGKQIFPDSAKIIGYTTASWPKKYVSQKIDEFEEWPATDILLKSKPEDKIWLCADMYCSCLWLRSRIENGSPFYGIIGDCLGEKSAQDMLRKYLKLIGLSSKTIMHKPIPFSNQMIGHRENIDQYQKWLEEQDVFAKCQYVLEKYGFTENNWEYKGISNDKYSAKWKGRCYSFRPQAYLMEATNCFWCAHQDYKYIGTTHRLESWYFHQVRVQRGW